MQILPLYDVITTYIYAISLLKQIISFSILTENHKIEYQYQYKILHLHCMLFGPLLCWFMCVYVYPHWVTGTTLLEVSFKCFLIFPPFLDLASLAPFISTYVHPSFTSFICTYLAQCLLRYNSAHKNNKRVYLVFNVRLNISLTLYLSY